MARLFGLTDVLQFDTSTNSGDTIAFWIRTTQATPNVEICSRHTALSRGGFGLSMDAAGLLTLAIKTNGGGTTLGISTVTSVNDGTWHHVALNMGFAGGTGCAIYRDGVLAASGTNSALSGGALAALRLGQSNDPFWVGFIGEIAEFGAWGFAGAGADQLTLAQIQALAAGFPPYRVSRKAALAYAPLINGTQNLVNSTPTTVTGTTVAPHPRMFG